MQTMEKGTVTAHDFAGRLARLQARMRDEGVDYVFVGPSSDLYYLAGLNLHSSERLALLVVAAEGPAHIVVPFFEVEGLGKLSGGMQYVSWQETEDPAHTVADLISGSGSGSGSETIAISDQLHAVFLLRLQNALPGRRFIEASGVLTPLRMVKDEYEVELMRAAGRVGDKVFEQIRELRFAGRTEQAVAAEIAELLLEAGVTAIEWGPIVGSGPNGANPHHSAGDRVIEVGDLVVLDYGGPVNGYQLDTTRTVAVGHAPEGEMLEVYELVREGQEKAVQAARPGITGQALDSVTRDIFTARGYGQYFFHRLGHGLGLDTHESPYIVQNNTVPLAAGNAFSIEPGIYISGRFGVRIEDIVILTEDGAERMNNAPREIVVVQ